MDQVEFHAYTNEEFPQNVIRRKPGMFAEALARVYMVGETVGAKVSDFSVRHDIRGKVATATSTVAAGIKSVDERLGVSQTLSAVDERLSISQKAQTVVAKTGEIANSVAAKVAANEVRFGCCRSLCGLTFGSTDGAKDWRCRAVGIGQVAKCGGTSGARHKECS